MNISPVKIQATTQSHTTTDSQQLELFDRVNKDNNILIISLYLKADFQRLGMGIINLFNSWPSLAVGSSILGPTIVSGAHVGAVGIN